MPDHRRSEELHVRSPASHPNPTNFRARLSSSRLSREDTDMAKVQVLNVAVLDNPSPFGNPFQFEITFECMEDLPEGE